MQAGSGSIVFGPRVSDGQGPLTFLLAFACGEVPTGEALQRDAHLDSHFTIFLGRLLLSKSRM